MGRPTKLTPQLQEQFCALLREKGLFRKHAAGLVGVSEDLVSQWFNRGAREDRGIFRDFHDAVCKAEAEWVESAHDTLKAAAAANPKQVQWLLSRRHPELYGRRDNVQDTSADEAAADAASARESLIGRLLKFLPAPAEPSAPPAPEVVPREE